MWLSGEDNAVCQLGNQNVFFLIKNATSGVKELITPSLDGTVVKGITRDSVMKLAGDKGVSVKEQHITMKDLTIALQEKRLVSVHKSITPFYPPINSSLL